MTAMIELQAKPRMAVGKGASRRLRSAGQVPAIVYGGKKEPVSITLEHYKVKRELENESFYSKIFNINLEGETQSVVLKAIQRHPFKPIIQHMDLLRVSKTDRLYMAVPLHFVGENVCQGLKLGGLLSRHKIELDITCLAADLPEYIEVNISALGLEETLHISDLKLPHGVTSVELAQGPEHDMPVVGVYKPRISEEKEAAEATAETQSKENG